MDTPRWAKPIPKNVQIASTKVAALRTSKMQAQTEKMKGELLFELHGKTVTTTIKDISPNGVKLEMNDTGEVKGKYNAMHRETVNVLIKTDGTNEWETKAIENTKDGDMVVAWGSGKGRSTGPTTASWEGEMHYMTMSPRLAWLNNTTAWIEGSGDMAKGEHQGKIYAKK